MCIPWKKLHGVIASKTQPQAGTESSKKRKVTENLDGMFLSILFVNKLFILE